VERGPPRPCPRPPNARPRAVPASRRILEVSAFTRLYAGETNVGFVPHRRRWYIMSAIAVVICFLSIGIRGFNFGVEFKGGNTLQFPLGTASVSDVQSAVGGSGVPVESVQKAGSGGSGTFVVTTKVLSETELSRLRSALSTDLGPKITVKGHPLSTDDISQNQVSASWGKDITRKAILALIVFLIAVSIFISSLFEWRLSVGAIVGVLHDLVISAGVYSIVGFEVTPSTVVGLLTILGYSLYDNIVVYDKVRENSRGILGLARQTYSEAANRAVNQTLARSINTSLIALLPVAGLLFVGAGLLGVGTIKDLALVLFIGLASGAYSSLFLATPIACDLKERQQQYVELRRKVALRRAARARTAATAETGDSRGPARTTTAVLDRDADAVDALGDDTAAEPDRAPKPGAAPRPGSRPQRSGNRARPQQRRGGRPPHKRKR